MSSYGGLQMIDKGITLYGCGARLLDERNPILNGYCDRPVAFSLISAAGAIGSMLAVREVYKRNKKAAKILLGILNGLYAGVVIWNAKQIR